MLLLGGTMGFSTSATGGGGGGGSFGLRDDAAAAVAAEAAAAARAADRALAASLIEGASWLQGGQFNRKKVSSSFGLKFHLNFGLRLRKIFVQSVLVICSFDIRAIWLYFLVIWSLENIFPYIKIRTFWL